MGNFASLKPFALFSLTGDSPGVPVPEDAAEAGAAAKVASRAHGPAGLCKIRRRHVGKLNLSVSGSTMRSRRLRPTSSAIKSK